MGKRADAAIYLTPRPRVPVSPRHFGYFQLLLIFIDINVLSVDDIVFAA